MRCHVWASLLLSWLLDLRSKLWLTYKKTDRDTHRMLQGTRPLTKRPRAFLACDGCKSKKSKV